MVAKGGVVGFDKGEGDSQGMGNSQGVALPALWVAAGCRAVT